jgi:microcystin-dependent protein
LFGALNVSCNATTQEACAQDCPMGEPGPVGPTGPAGVGPTGTIVAFAGTAAPTGWLLCDGSEVSRESYAELFTAIGSLYGDGDGVNTFNLPDLRGRTPIGAGQGLGLSDREVAETVGAESHALSVSELPPHNHTSTVFNPVGDLNQNGLSGLAVRGGPQVPSAFGASQPSDDTGGGEAHDIMQPSLAVTFLIKE